VVFPPPCPGILTETPGARPQVSGPDAFKFTLGDTIEPGTSCSSSWSQCSTTERPGLYPMPLFFRGGARRVGTHRDHPRCTRNSPSGSRCSRPRSRDRAANDDACTPPTGRGDQRGHQLLKCLPRPTPQTTTWPGRSGWEARHSTANRGAERSPSCLGDLYRGWQDSLLEAKRLRIKISSPRDPAPPPSRIPPGRSRQLPRDRNYSAAQTNGPLGPYPPARNTPARLTPRGPFPPACHRTVPSRDRARQIGAMYEVDVGPRQAGSLVETASGCPAASDNMRAAYLGKKFSSNRIGQNHLPVPHPGPRRAFRGPCG